MDIIDTLDNARDALNDTEENLQEAQQFIGELRRNANMLRKRGDDWKAAALRNATEAKKNLINFNTSFKAWMNVLDGYDELSIKLEAAQADAEEFTTLGVVSNIPWLVQPDSRVARLKAELARTLVLSLIRAGAVTYTERKVDGGDTEVRAHISVNIK